jgi:TolA-binding protein
VSNPDIIDLIARARRGVLSSEERARLDLVLEAKVEERLLLRAGQGFDASASVLAGDHQLLENVIRAVEERARRTRRPEPESKPGRGEVSSPRRRRFVPLLAASLYLLLGGMAGAALAETWFALIRPSAPTPSQINAVQQPRGHALLVAPSSAQLTPVRVPQTRGPLLAAESDSASTARAAEQHRLLPLPSIRATSAAIQRAPDASPPHGTAPAPGSAATLYALANQARVSGNRDAAVRSYLDLLARFPSSAEALASHLTLGNLYLVSGEARLALAEFRAHQAGGGAGFGAESAWGIAGALGQLGRHAEEREALLWLLSHYPNSVYEAGARRKLGRRN